MPSEATVPLVRLRRVWLILIAATSLSFVAYGEVIRSPAIVAMLIVGLAYIKARLVLLDFMEMRAAPTGWRLASECWLAVTSMLILAFALA